jgi:type I restriction enzyme, S subunit
MAGKWPVAKWGDIATLAYGKALSGYSETKGTVQVYGTNGPIGWHNEARWDGPGVVVGRKGAYRGVHYTADPYWVIDTAYSLRPKTDLNLRWVYYQLKFLDVNNIDDGSPIPSTTRDAFYAQELLVPPREEQDQIAGLLSSFDDKIDLNRRIAATLEEMARALFKSWFVDFDPVRAKAEGRDPGLPADTAALFPDRLGEDGLPEGWRVQPMLDQAFWVNGAAYKDMHFSDAPDALPVVKIVELKNGIVNGTKWTNTDLGDRYKIREGELLFSWSGSPDTSIDAFIWMHGEAWLNQHIFAVRPNGEASLALLYAMLKFFKPALIEIARDKQTTGLGHVTRQDMIRLKVCMGEPRVRAAFDQIAEPLFSRLKLVIQENSRLAVLRDTLLPKLISGELRIKDAQAEVEAA